MFAGGGQLPLQSFWSIIVIARKQWPILNLGKTAERTFARNGARFRLSSMWCMAQIGVLGRRLCCEYIVSCAEATPQVANVHLRLSCNAKSIILSLWWLVDTEQQDRIVAVPYAKLASAA